VRRTTTRRAAAFAIGIVLIGAGQVGADRAAAKDGANTFSGSCKVSGTAVWNPPITNTPQAAAQGVQATGTCSGTFTGSNGRAHQLNNALVSWQTTEYTSDASCSAETDSGIGKIAFQYGTISFTISEIRVAPVASFTLKGAAGGSAAGEANISPNADPVAITEACGGAGLAEAPTDIQMATTSSISG
jgi:hypothetical protein